MARSIPITAVKTMRETTRGFVRRQNWTPMPGCAFTIRFVGGKKPLFDELTTSSSTNRSQGCQADASLLGPQIFGVTPTMAPLSEQTWEAFTAPWDTDVKAGFQWIQEALRSPLARGSRVLLTSSGAAVRGSPLSGGYAGAKRML